MPVIREAIGLYTKTMLRHVSFRNFVSNFFTKHLHSEQWISSNSLFSPLFHHGIHGKHLNSFFCSMALLCYSLSREVTNRPRPKPVLLYEEKNFTLHVLKIKIVVCDQEKKVSFWIDGKGVILWFEWRNHTFSASAPKQTHISNTCTQLLGKWFPFQTIRKIKRRLIYITIPFAHLSCHGHDDVMWCDVMCHWWTQTIAHCVE